ncbi:hypothetical protein ASD21_10915 [Caulobacter sp. Root1455]|uniref:hypothetical protein n=1 Tax=unclassified Caulobacter TaxID=2648921 RepID=UPI0006FFE4B8|nr:MULTISPECIES: hypothetical protein [unclassified Caulobacter]KQY35297.1 hypothetical protein ASD38_01640 [Caulobacter sp. Root487D2Y]KQY93273.1 hypothetical protein ASD21_10915 [Caulobacter sp. Root1455]
MRRKRSRTIDVEEGESYYVSMTDMMVGVIFIFIIMLSYFAFEFRSSTAKLATAKHPETAALLQTAANLQPKTADIEIDYGAQVLCVPEATLSESGQGAAGERRCFAYSPPKPSALTASAIDAQKLLMQALDADLRDARVPITGDPSGGSLNFRADQLFVAGTAALSPDGQRIAGDVAQILMRRLPCLGYGVAAEADCEAGPKLAVANVVSQTNLDIFSTEGQQAATLALQRAVALHQALTAAQPGLASLRNAPTGQAGSQPLLRVASVGQSQEGASKVGDDQTVSIQFQMGS